MKKSTEFEYLITMPAKFDWHLVDCGLFSVDIFNNPNGLYEQMLVSGFYSFFGELGVQDKVRFLSDPKINSLVSNYGYELSHSYKYSVTKNLVSMKLIIKTNAVGRHLENLLENILINYLWKTEGCGIWLEDANISYNGWQNMDHSALEECRHDFTRIQFMGDSNNVVEILECVKCREVVKRKVEELK
ncbi:MAG: hypothetical protein [Caudoviricetes sp.]|nr:MAG: hypothetical protein [Caudoviricetes sp.]